MRTIIGKIKGITFHIGENEIFNYKEGDYLKLKHEPDNEHDENAIGIYDHNNKKLGFIAKDKNKIILNLITNYKYYCIISKIFYDTSTPSIEYNIVICDKKAKDMIFENEYKMYQRFVNVKKNNPEEIDESIFRDVKTPATKHKNVKRKGTAETNDVTKLLEKFQYYFDNKKYKDALCYAKKAANLNSWLAHYHLGWMYRNGEGIEIDYQKSVHHFLNSIDCGSNNYCDENNDPYGPLGFMLYDEFIEENTKLEAEAFKYLIKGVLSKNPYACYYFIIIASKREIQLPYSIILPCLEVMRNSRYAALVKVQKRFYDNDSNLKIMLILYKEKMERRYQRIEIEDINFANLFEYLSDSEKEKMHISKCK